jgi:hypothetical protein
MESLERITVYDWGRFRAELLLVGISTKDGGKKKEEGSRNVFLPYLRIYATATVDDRVAKRTKNIQLFA